MIIKSNMNTKGRIMNVNDELFGYELDVDDNFTFIKTKYNFKQILDELIEIIHDDNCEIIKKYLKQCLLTADDIITSIHIAELCVDADMWIENNIIKLKNFMLINDCTIYEIDMSNYIIEQTIIKLDK